MTTSMLLYVPVFWTAFCGSRNRKQKQETEPDISPWNKKREDLGFLFFGKRQSVAFLNRVLAFCFRRNQLWLAALHKARVQAYISDVISIQNPG